MNYKIKKIEYFFIIIVVILFFVLANKYIAKGVQSRVDVKEAFNGAVAKISEKIKAEKEVICKENQIKISVEGGDLCREKFDSTNKEDNRRLEIFDTYPKSAKGKEIIYGFLDEGDIAIADFYLKNEIKIERYDTIKVKKITWEEDPYKERYWRFIFYSLRGTRHLLYAFKETGDEKYKDKLIEIIESFIVDGTDKPHAWDDYHGVAFRAMALTNTWWKLREQNALPAGTSGKMLEALQKHGEFLLEEEHYEKKYNHGISQTAALFILAVNFPDIENANKWMSVAMERLSSGIKNLIDNDGILVENSPYYHFYALEKFWRILQFTSKYNINIKGKFQETVNKMISYATYILQPDLKVPLLGASLERTVGRNGALKEIAKENPEFLYVLTQGKKGKQPQELNKYYPTAGRVIMRSGWKRKTKFKNKFKDQTQVVFDVGPYRTDHSDFDALSFTLYSNGKTLITDSGLYTYDPNDDLKAYFHGTRGHNTVLVDGKDQRVGAPTHGEFKQNNGYVSFSAQHNLYQHVVHQRAIALFGHDLVLIIDRLISSQEHDYEQLFHLFPEAKIKVDGTTVVANGNNKKENLIITQLLPENIELTSAKGDEGTGEGFCSFEYEKKVPCYRLSYKKRAKTASFITLLQVGDNMDISANAEDNNKIIIKTKNKTYKIDTNELDIDFAKKSKLREEIVKNYSLDLALENNEWILKGNGNDKFLIEDENGKMAIIPKNRDENPIFSERPYYIAEFDNIDSYYSIDQDIYTDIPSERREGYFRIYEQEDFLPILGYHHIRPDDYVIEHPKLEMRVSDFEKQIDYTTNKMGFRWFTFGDIMENYVLKEKKIPKRACIMNFDDGRKNHFTNGYRIFKKYGAVATFYIITKRVLKNSDDMKSSDYMNRFDLEELHNNGNEIGSHTVSAGSLLTDGYDKNGLIYQLEKSKQDLENEGHNITTFAYPRGDQNQEIVDLAKEFYAAGRDTSKDNVWRERRPAAISFDEDYMWHMHYHKPELETPKELEKSIGYNNWWQFEEGYRVDNDSNNSIRTLSSVHPTDNSYAVVNMEDVGDKISNKFIVSKKAEYVIEIFGTINTEESPEYSNANTMNVYIDGVSRKIKRGDGGECVLYQKNYYGFYNVFVNLKEGPHTISIEAAQRNVNVDKFRMYRPIKIQNSYNLTITELKRVPPREKPYQIKTDITIKNRISAWVFLALPVAILLILFLFFKFKKSQIK